MKFSNISRRLFVAGAAGATVSPFADAHGAVATDPAGFAAPITAIPFGSHSHWLQPWRELCRTVSAAQIEAGIGVMIGGFKADQDSLDMLRQYGFRHVRVEIAWGLVDAKAETVFQGQDVIVAYLARLRTAGLRPLILLNANSGYPCPATLSKALVLAPANEGDRSLTLDSTTGLVPARSGLQKTGLPGMASILITTIDGQQVTLSRPLPKAIPAGTEMQIATLNYEPFSEPGTPRNERTMLGWLRYVDLVAELATTALGTANASDRGFDLEIWNELTFGSRFLGINNYYDPELLNYNPRLTWTDIVSRTAAHIAAAGTAYSGVRITDGFANTIPWPAASAEPPRISAISKHPYPPDHHYPKDEQANTVPLDAFGRRTAFIPSYAAYFPEYYANVIQTESLCRDVSDRTDNVGRAAHGRLARTVNGHINPVYVWITEIGCTPNGLGVDDPQQAGRLTTVFALRSLFFHLAIGVERVYIYTAFSAPGDFGLVNQAAATIPTLPLLAISRLLSKIKGNSGGSTAGDLASLTLTAYRGSGDKIMFNGGGSPNLPPMSVADSLVLLPVQASPARISIIYYVMSRDVRVPLDEQAIQVSIQGGGIQNSTITCYDPVSDTYPALNNPALDLNQVVLELPATDSPRVLVFE